MLRDRPLPNRLKALVLLPLVSFLMAPTCSSGHPAALIHPQSTPNENMPRFSGIPFKSSENIGYSVSTEGIGRTTNGAVTWEEPFVRWADILDSANPEAPPTCNSVIDFGGQDPKFFTMGDSDIRSERPFLLSGPHAPGTSLGSYETFASTLIRGGPAAQFVVVYHTGMSGKLLGPSAGCVVLDAVALTKGRPDKPSLAYVELPEKSKLAGELWVAWTSSIAHDPLVYTKIPVNLDGSFGTPAKVQFIPHPTDPGSGIDWLKCTPPPPGGVDEAGRSNLFADTQGNVYIASQNSTFLSPDNAPTWSGPEHIFLHKLQGQLPGDTWFRCIDEIPKPRVSGGLAGMVEPNDPTVVADPADPKTLLVAYLTLQDVDAKDVKGKKYRTTVSSSTDGGGTWSRFVFPSFLSNEDQDQPHITVTTSLDSRERTSMGTYFVTWYEGDPSGVFKNGVTRLGQVFLTPPVAGMSLSPFVLSDPLVPRRTDAGDFWVGGDRGVNQNQGGGYLPASPDWSAGKEGGAGPEWVGVWTQPTDPTIEHPKTSDFSVFSNHLP